MNDAYLDVKEEDPLEVDEGMMGVEFTGFVSPDWSV